MPSTRPPTPATVTAKAVPPHEGEGCGGDPGKSGGGDRAQPDRKSDVFFKGVPFSLSTIFLYPLSPLLVGGV